MSSKIQLIPIDMLTPHPGNPNQMSRATFAKLVRNIERTGRYEPLIVRPCQLVARSSSLVARCNKSTVGGNNEQRTMNKEQHFQIINGHHRWLALKELGYKTADAIVWDVDDGEADILLATLNRLCGQDVLDKKIALLKRLNEKSRPAQLAKLLPQTKAQLQKLINLDSQRVSSIKYRASNFASPLVFFVSDSQQQVVETAIDCALQDDKPAVFTGGPCQLVARSSSLVARCNKSTVGGNNEQRTMNKAARRASALSAICRYYLDHEQ